MQSTDKQGPVWSHNSDVAKQPEEGHTRQLYSAMVNYADTKLGEVVDLIKLKGMYNETLIVFTTDNGNATLLACLVHCPDSWTHRLDGNRRPRRCDLRQRLSGGLEPPAPWRKHTSNLPLLVNSGGCSSSGMYLRVTKCVGLV